MSKQKIGLGSPYPRNNKSWVATKNLGKAQANSSLETSEGTNWIIWWFYTCSLKDCERMHFCWFQKCLWRLIVPALRPSDERGSRQAAVGYVGSIAISYCKSVQRAASLPSTNAEKWSEWPRRGLRPRWRASEQVQHSDLHYCILSDRCQHGTIAQPPLRET